MGRNQKNIVGVKRKGVGIATKGWKPGEKRGQNWEIKRWNQAKMASVGRWEIRSMEKIQSVNILQ